MPEAACPPSTFLRGLARLIIKGVVFLSSAVAVLGSYAIVSACLVNPRAGFHALEKHRLAWVVLGLIALRTPAFVRLAQRVRRRERARLAAMSASERRDYWAGWSVVPAMLVVMASLGILLEALSSLPANEPSQLWYSKLTFLQNCAAVFTEFVTGAGLLAVCIWTCYKEVVKAPSSSQQLPVQSALWVGVPPRRMRPPPKGQPRKNVSRKSPADYDALELFD